MQNTAEKSSQWISIGKAARYLGVSRDTLRRWEKKGEIKPFRSPTNRRYYTPKQLDELILFQKSQKRAASKPPVRKLRKGLAIGRKQVLITIGIFGLGSIVILTFLSSSLFKQHFSKTDKPDLELDQEAPLSPLAP